MKAVLPIANGFRWSDSFEAPVCMRLNRANASPWLRSYFTLAGRLGNGVVWYSLLAALPFLFGFESIPAAVHVGITALVGVLIYKLCKLLLVRERPYVTHTTIRCYGIPLDRGSFPSGHTIHAVSFTIMLGTLYPVMLWLLVPLAVSIALSRIVLGHHYPSDVVAGAVIGALLANTSLSLMPAALL